LPAISFSAGRVRGAPAETWSELDLAAPARRHDDQQSRGRTGNGGDIRGHPLDALVWLANALAARQIAEGKLVPADRPGGRDQVGGQSGQVEAGGLGARGQFHPKVRSDSERCGCARHRPICGRQELDAGTLRDCEMQRVKRAQWVIGQWFNKVVRRDRMSVRQWLDLRIPAANVDGKISHGRPLVRRVDFGSAPPLQTAAELQHHQTTDHHARACAQERVEILGAGFVDVALRERTGIDVGLSRGHPDLLGSAPRCRPLPAAFFGAVPPATGYPCGCRGKDASAVSGNHDLALLRQDMLQPRQDSAHFAHTDRAHRGSPNGCHSFEMVSQKRSVRGARFALEDLLQCRTLSSATVSGTRRSPARQTAQNA
jgi:hypothetical protein